MSYFTALAWLCFLAHMTGNGKVFWIVIAIATIVPIVFILSMFIWVPIWYYYTERKEIKSGRLLEYDIGYNEEAYKDVSSDKYVIYKDPKGNFIRRVTKEEALKLKYKHDNGYYL